LNLMARGSRYPKSGTSMGWFVESPEKRKQRAKAKKRQEERWAAKSGPVKVLHRDPEKHEESEEQAAAD